MIIIDMNQISLASLMMNMHMNKTTEVEEDMVRHMILNSVRMYRSMFKEKYGTRKIQLFQMCSPKIKTTFLFVKNKKFPKDNVIKQVEIESNTFNKAVKQYKNRLRGEKSLRKYIDTKITKRVWEAMISAFIQYEYRNFKKK